MALKIKRTGLDQYAPGGEARIRMLCIGGPDAGKTRMSSFWPRPIFANCEAGLASIADRGAAFVDVTDSRSMLQFLLDLEQVCRIPYADREFQTVVIDTLDSWQRKVKDEYLRAHPEMQSFRGFDAYGYLESKTSQVLARLLNLDMNVIVNVHYKDKTIREGTGDNATERSEIVLQLIGDVKDSIFNDFDLVGWLGTYWAPGPQGGDNRIEKRGLTFKKSPDRPFLKDRLGVTPPWIEIDFSEDDYYKLFAAVIDRLDSIPESQEVRDLAPIGPERGGEAVSLGGGAVPPQQPAKVPLAQLDKPSLQMKCREYAAAAEKFGLPDVVDLLKFAGNTTKAELIDRLEKAREPLNEAAKKAQSGEAAAPADAATSPQQADSVASGATPAEPEQPPAQEPAPEATPEPAPAPETPVAPATPEPAPEPTPEQAPEQAPAPAAEPAPPTAPTPEPAPAPAAEPTPPPAAAAVPAQETPVATETVQTDSGPAQVNTATGEITSDDNVANAAAALGGEVVSEPQQAEAPTEAPAPAAPPAEPTAPAAAAPPAAGGRQIPEVCQREGCDTQLAGENQDYVKISFVKFRNFFCNKDFTEAKAAGKVPWPVKQTAAV